MTVVVVVIGFSLGDGVHCVCVRGQVAKYIRVDVRVTNGGRGSEEPYETPEEESSAESAATSKNGMSTRILASLGVRTAVVASFGMDGWIHSRNRKPNHRSTPAQQVLHCTHCGWNSHMHAMVLSEYHTQELRTYLGVAV
ncbi:hypothetical protein P3T76_000283 [Phytophthora citrophthora]|uniref:Secreted protein n=1 Tax=Phytophthora citrophthora TaxID=4793 RepID=A0AAD9LSI9_9STRA|nr:hypothetical protein P3T76_000283 [Phytophthora citrophthora]